LGGGRGRGAPAVEVAPPVPAAQPKMRAGMTKAPLATPYTGPTAPLTRPRTPTPNPRPPIPPPDPRPPSTDPAALRRCGSGEGEKAAKGVRLNFDQEKGGLTPVALPAGRLRVGWSQPLDTQPPHPLPPPLGPRPRSLGPLPLAPAEGRCPCPRRSPRRPSRPQRPSLPSPIPQPPVPPMALQGSDLLGQRQTKWICCGVVKEIDTVFKSKNIELKVQKTTAKYERK